MKVIIKCVFVFIDKKTAMYGEWNNIVYEILLQIVVSLDNDM